MNKDWYLLKIEDIFNILDSNKNGLNKKEVSNRLKNYGLNVISEVGSVFDTFVIKYNLKKTTPFGSDLIYIRFLLNPILYLSSFVFTGSMFVICCTPSLIYLISKLLPCELLTHSTNISVVVTFGIIALLNYKFNVKNFTNI